VLRLVPAADRNLARRTAIINMVVAFQILTILLQPGDVSFSPTCMPSA